MKNAERKIQPKPQEAEDQSDNKHFLYIMKAYYDIVLQKAHEIHEKYSVQETNKKNRSLEY